MRLALLLLFVASCGIKNPQCDEKHIENVKEYTMQKCMNIFGNPDKCEIITENRVKELRKNCK